MTTKQYRHPAEADACKKETGHDPKQGRTPSTSTDPDFTRETSRETERERGLFLPLLWAELGKPAKPAKFRGKAKRKSRAAAINAKRYQGAVDSGLAGLLALAVVAGVLLMGVV